MPSRFLPVVLAVIAALLIVDGAATGKTPPAQPTQVETSEDLWATINVCDTAAHPDTIGIRGSMPGLGDRPSTLKMRFRVQYKTTADGKWRNADRGSDSGWRKVGRTQGESREAGRNFVFVPPAGGAHTLRGSVRFKWLRRGQVVERARRLTELGHESTAGADPAGFSASVCRIA